MKIKDEIKERATSRTVIPYDIIDMSRKNNLKCKQSSNPQYKTDNMIKCDGKIGNLSQEKDKFISGKRQCPRWTIVCLWL